MGRFFKDSGRPQNVYFAGNLRNDLVRHEVLFTEFRLGMRPDKCVRLWEVDKELKPDGEMEFGQVKVYVELDTGEVPYRRIIGKYQKYADALKGNSLVVWVALTEARMRGLARRSKVLDGRCAFTVLGWEHWVDRQGGIIFRRKSPSVGRDGR